MNNDQFKDFLVKGLEGYHADAVKLVEKEYQGFLKRVNSGLDKLEEKYVLDMLDKVEGEQ